MFCIISTLKYVTNHIQRPLFKTWTAIKPLDLFLTLRLWRWNQIFWEYIRTLLSTFVSRTFSAVALNSGYIWRDLWTLSHQIFLTWRWDIEINTNEHWTWRYVKIQHIRGLQKRSLPKCIPVAFCASTKVSLCQTNTLMKIWSIKCTFKFNQHLLRVLFAVPVMVMLTALLVFPSADSHQYTPLSVG